MNEIVAVTKSYIESQIGRLAMTYLAIIMAMTIVFSAVIYSITTSQLDQTIPSQLEQFDFLPRPQLEAIFLERASQARSNLLSSLAFLNFAAFICGAVLSHFLAKKALEPIEVAMEAQKQFVSDASHELRTPLTALQTTNEVALRKKGLTLDDAKELMRYNILEVIKLRELTNSLLGLVKQETADVSKQAINIQDAVTTITRTFAAVLEERSIVVENNVPYIRVRTNRSALEQILAILLDNAIKYSPKHSKVRINAVDVDDDVYIHVIDEGIGIEKKQQAKIFDRFYRVDQSRSGNVIEGTGLGLSIAKSISDRQGMQLSVKSTLKKGSIFTLHIKK